MDKKHGVTTMTRTCCEGSGDDDNVKTSRWTKNMT